MALPDVTPDSFEILVVRELRKVGLEVTDPRVHRRTELPEPQQGFLLELLVWLSRDTWRQRALVACRRQDGAGTVEREAIDTLAGRLPEAKANVGLLFATAAFAADALAAGEEHGIALLQLVDARAAYDAGGWGDPGHYPIWLPAWLVQLVDRDPASGQARRRLLEAGRAELLTERLRSGGGSPTQGGQG
jgi:restriction system protein